VAKTKSPAKGKLSDFGGVDAAKQFRVRVYYKDSNYPEVVTWKTYLGAQRGRIRLAEADKKARKYSKIDPITALVYDKAAKGYREVVIDKAARLEWYARR